MMPQMLHHLPYQEKYIAVPEIDYSDQGYVIYREYPTFKIWIKRHDESKDKEEENIHFGPVPTDG